MSRVRAACRTKSDVRLDGDVPFWTVAIVLHNAATFYIIVVDRLEMGQQKHQSQQPNDVNHGE
jgi:hypothetical protein